MPTEGLKGCVACELDTVLAEVARLQEMLTARLNGETELVDEERRRWYHALGGDLEGLAPETAAIRVNARAEQAESRLAAVQAKLRIWLNRADRGFDPEESEESVGFWNGCRHVAEDLLALCAKEGQ